MRAPQEFVKRHAQARWRALSARDRLERRVARLQQLSLGAQQHLITRTLTDKVQTNGARRRGAARQPGPRRLLKHWNPRTRLRRSRCCTPSG